MSEDFLLPKDDGLTMRETHAYAKYKLDALKFYLHVTNTSMRGKWKNRCYIDLQAGPGKNRIGDTNEVIPENLTLLCKLP